MGFMKAISSLEVAYASGGGATSHEEAGEHYAQVADSVPSSILGSAIGPALASLGTQALTQKIFDSAGQMSSGQRGNLVQSLLGGLSSSGVNLSSLLPSLGVSQSVADNPESASPEDVAKLAAHAHETNPNVFQSAMSFFSEHPALVKTFGAVAIGAIIQQLGNKAAKAKEAS
jgi:hypothetical protein